MNNQLMFSSKNQAWDTPQDFFDKQNAIFSFDLDVCATEQSAKCANYFTPEINGLEQKWLGVCWCNPPYGSEQTEWIKKAYLEAQAGRAQTVMLLPARTDTKVFHRYIWDEAIDSWRTGVQGIFIKGRLTFGSNDYWQWVWEQEIINGKPNTLYGKIGKKNPAPFPSMLVIFNPIKL